MGTCFGLEVDGQTGIVDFGAATVPNTPCTNLDVIVSNGLVTLYGA